MYSVIRSQTFTLAEFPHSEICALTPICGYTQLIAACHVLHRLLVPRHSPCALNSLNTVSILSFDYLRVIKSPLVINIEFPENDHVTVNLVRLLLPDLRLA